MAMDGMEADGATVVRECMNGFSAARGMRQRTLLSQMRVEYIRADSAAQAGHSVSLCSNEDACKLGTNQLGCRSLSLK